MAQPSAHDQFVDAVYWVLPRWWRYFSSVVSNDVVGGFGGEVQRKRDSIDSIVISVAQRSNGDVVTSYKACGSESFEWPCTSRIEQHRSAHRASDHDIPDNYTSMFLDTAIDHAKDIADRFSKLGLPVEVKFLGSTLYSA